MTVTSAETSRDPQRIVVRDSTGPLRFQGEIIADLSWTYDDARARGHHRWTDITLYRVLQSGSYKYVIQIVGRSVLYHQVGGPCRSGVNVPVARLARNEDRYDNLVGCPRIGCQPPDLDELGDTAQVAVEENLYTLYKCKNADEVVDVMLTRDLKSGKSGMSGLSVKLLQTASAVDEEIEEAMIETRQLD